MNDQAEEGKWYTEVHLTQRGAGCREGLRGHSVLRSCKGEAGVKHCGGHSGNEPYLLHTSERMTGGLPHQEGGEYKSDRNPIQPINFREDT